MANFVDLLRRNRVLYVFALSLVTTVLLINEGLEFAENIKRNIMLALFSLVVFYFLVRIAIEGKIWARK